MSGFSAVFVEQADVGDDHVALDGLAHVIDRERRDAHRRQRFHLNACLAMAADLAADVQGGFFDFK